MPSPSPEARAKIAAALRAYYAKPEHQAKHRETSRAGGRSTTARKAELEAENAKLRQEVEALRAEVERLRGSQVSREPDGVIRADARAETSEITGDPTTARGNAIAAHRTPERAR